MQIGILGLGKMGSRVMDKLLQGGHEVVGWNRTKDVIEQLKVSRSEYLIKNTLRFSFSVEGMRETLMKPRIFWLMMPQGEPATEIISQLEEIIEPGDIIIDGGDSNYKDTQKRYEELGQKGIKFLGIGIAGGIMGLESGFSLMVGGNKDGYEYIRPALDSLATPEGGHNYFGEGGAGHFVKMVHDGIEYGIMQSIGEGLGVLQKSSFGINVLEAASVWQRGSILRSFILDMAVNSFVNDQDFINRQGIIESNGGTKWLVETAAEEHISVDAITKSLEFQQHSEFDKATQNTFAAKIISAVRKQFSGQEDKKAI